MRRARAFVLIDKQRTILPLVERLLASCITDCGAADYTDEERDRVVGSVRATFGVELSRRDTKEEWGMEALGLSGHIAKVLLDRDPPDTSPRWSAP